MSQVPIIALKPANLTKVLCGFPPTPHTNAEIVPTIRPQLLPWRLFQIHYHKTPQHQILSFELIKIVSYQTYDTTDGVVNKTTN